MSLWKYRQDFEIDFWYYEINNSDAGIKLGEGVENVFKKLIIRKGQLFGAQEYQIIDIKIDYAVWNWQNIVARKHYIVTRHKTFLCDDFMNNKAKQRAKISILPRSVYNHKEKGNP